jgi:hypothetical protein
MKKLPENFTKEEHAAWVRHHDKKEKRNEIIAGVIVYGGIGTWLLYSYLTAKEHEKEVMVWFLIGGYAYYDICKRIDNLRDILRNQKN